VGILKRIRSCLENIEGREPWPYGFDGEKASPKAKSAWAALSIEERLAISRYNPYRHERNAMLLELSRRGLTQSIISEISGVPIRTVEKIMSEKKHG